jgi:DNA-directed RNA polymerase subunit RPC12/RpoP
MSKKSKMSAQQKAESLAKQVMQAMAESKAAEARAISLGKKMMAAVAQAKKEAKEAAEAASRVVEYPSGRYECGQCGQSVLITNATNKLPACDNCGSNKIKGHEPKVTVIEPPAPKKYAAGMYVCSTCETRAAVAVDTNNLPDCDYCGSKLKPLSS